jgi:predicted 3-demethylubiquinone-9 3-methyltransferase (glyoxalase superfamily)
MPKISPMLWFNDNADEAAAFYASVFKDSEIFSGLAGEGGKSLTVSLRLFDQHLTLLNGGPEFPPSESFSLVIDCVDQVEVDYYWDALIAGGGEESQCGWLKDRFGISWQVTPRRLLELVSDPDPARAQAATQAMLKMQKIVIADLEAAVAAV